MRKEEIFMIGLMEVVILLIYAILPLWLQVILFILSCIAFPFPAGNAYLISAIIFGVFIKAELL